MDRQKAALGRALLGLAIAVFALLAFTFLLDLAAQAAVGAIAEGNATAFTAAHFSSPRWAGVFVYGGVALMGVALIAFMLPLAVLAERTNDGEAMVTASSPRFSGKSVWVGAACILAGALLFKAASIEPMIAGEGRAVALARFAAGFNSALAAKARFDEKEYVARMELALLADRASFGRFARSWYWAYFADEGVTRASNRLDSSIELLEPLWREGRLTDAAAFELAKLYSEKNLTEKALTVLDSLLTRNPASPGYAEFKAALAAENEKRHR